MGFACVAAASMGLSIETRSPVALVPLALLAIPAAAYVALAVDPAVLLTLGVFLTPFAGNWQQLGLPGILAPDRLLIAATVGLVLLRAVTGRRPLPPLRPVHWVLALALLWAVGSALVSHTLFQRASRLKIVEAYGAFPFLIFYLAPVIYDTPRRRQMLLTALVILGAYLGLTVLFEMVGPHALVWPKYIDNPNYGIHRGRGRGPFADAVANGFGLYTCGLAACIAVTKWRGSARIAAGGVAALCFHRHAAHPGALGMDRRRCRHHRHDARVRAAASPCGAGHRRRSRGHAPGTRSRPRPLGKGVIARLRPRPGLG